MTTYTAIPDASLEPGKPARSVDAILLRDNPIAITEGASGAPKIQTAALETSLIDNYIAGMSAGGVGTYVWATRTAGSTATSIGTTVAGSALRVAGTRVDSSSGETSFNRAAASGTALSGTWRFMANVTTSAAGTYSTGLWLRIS